MSIDYCLLNEKEKIVCEGFGSNMTGSLYCLYNDKVISFMNYLNLKSDGIIKVGVAGMLVCDYEDEGYTEYTKENFPR